MREIYIDSRRRKEPHGNTYTLYIQEPIKNITAVDLVAATVPNTIYNITNGTNVFKINSNSYSIPSGFYSSSGLYKTINTSNCEVSMSLFENEGKYIFTSNSPFSLQVNSNEFSMISGFNQGVLYSNVATVSNGIYDTSLFGKRFIKSSNVVNFKTYGEYIFLDIEELRRPFSIEAVEDPYKADSSARFAVIPMDVNSGCIKTYKEQSDYKITVEYPKPLDKIDRLTVRWLDWKGDLVNFNGVDENQILLRFHTIEHEYKEEEQKTESHNIVSTFKKPSVHMLFLFLLVIFVLLSFKKIR